MSELQDYDTSIWFTVPERSRLIEGLHAANLAGDFYSPLFSGQRLTGHEIDALIFGHRLHGRSLESGEEHGASVSADGAEAIAYGDWASGSGSAQIDGDQICFVWSSTNHCAIVLRNPGGTRAKENEFILFAGFPTGLGYPFSRAD
jgi:hypothetical protein